MVSLNVPEQEFQLPSKTLLLIFNYLQASKNAKYVCLIPFAESSSGLFKTATVQQFQSPFDSAPATCQAGSSIRNFNVRIGSNQVFDISYDYDFHSFCNEFAKICAINGDLTAEISNWYHRLPTLEQY